MSIYKKFLINTFGWGSFIKSQSALLQWTLEHTLWTCRWRSIWPNKTYMLHEVCSDSCFVALLWIFKIRSAVFSNILHLELCIPECFWRTAAILDDFCLNGHSFFAKGLCSQVSQGIVACRYFVFQLTRKNLAVGMEGPLWFQVLWNYIRLSLTNEHFAGQTIWLKSLVISLRKSFFYLSFRRRGLQRWHGQTW